MVLLEKIEFSSTDIKDDYQEKLLKTGWQRETPMKFYKEVQGVKLVAVQYDNHFDPSLKALNLYVERGYKQTVNREQINAILDLLGIQ